MPQLTLDAIAFLSNQLYKMEDFKPHPYKDTMGNLTIAIGRNLDTTGISFEEGQYLLANDIKRVEAELTAHIPVFLNLDEPRQIVLMNMCFNMGVHVLMEFVHFIEALKNSDWELASKSMLSSLWAKEVGNRAVLLAHIMETGTLS